MSDTAQFAAKVRALIKRVRIRAVVSSLETKPFLANRDHVIGVEAFDVFRRLRDPLVDDARVTSLAARLIR